MNIVDELKKLKIGKVLNGILMKDYTTYKVGGPVLALVIPNDIKSLIKLKHFINEFKIKHKIIGNGSNIIFNDTPYDGIIIKLDKFDNLDIKNNMVTVGAGYSLIKLAMKLSNMGYTGLEFATGIPGTIGGAVYMNAGAYNSDMGYIVKNVKVLTKDLEVKIMSNKDLAYHYRTSFLKNNPDYICLEATLLLKKGNKELIMEIVRDRQNRRLATQPLEFPSAGSVFRNPQNDYAGRLIEELGYKGKGIGDAIISNKHANFIINKGHAKGEDIKNLINNIKKQVKEKYDIDLKVEQEFVE